MKTRILLDERAELAKSMIDREMQQAENFTKLLDLLNDCGLKLTSVNNWNEVETELKTKFQFANATIDFNLEALGIKPQYETAKHMYDNFLRGATFKTNVTNARIEEIKEQHRIYTANEKQTEAYNLIHSLAKDLNRARELGIYFEFGAVYNFTHVFNSEKHNTVIEVDEKRSFDAILNIK